MPRNKIIPDDKLLILIKEFFDKDCGGDGDKLKFPAIAKYIASHGYPSFTDYTLRRNQAARNYIDELKHTADSRQYSLLVTFTPLNVAEFLSVHRTRDSLQRALLQHDLYYQSIAESAVHFNQKYATLQKERDQLEDEVVSLQGTVRVLSEKNSRLQEKVQSLTSNNKRLQDEVKKYVYPGIARRILVQDGILEEDESIIMPDVIDRFVITPSDCIQTEYIPPQPDAAAHEAEDKILSGSNVISGLFKQFGKDTPDA